MLYKADGVISRTVEEKYYIEIEANDPDEAKDVAYAILSEFPNAEFDAKRLLCKERTTVDGPKVLDINIHLYPVGVANDEMINTEEPLDRA